MIAVNLEMGMVFEGADGRRVIVQGGAEGTYEDVPLDVYRRYAWQGLFRRRLVRVHGFGREYWIDENWRVREQLRRGEALRLGIPVEQVDPPRKKCGGCGGRKA